MATPEIRGYLDIPPATYARFKATLPALSLIKKRDAKHQGPRKAGVALDTIILHDTESTPHSTFASTVRYFADPQDGRVVSIHYLIGRDYGEIVAMVPEHRRANHCVNFNSRSIGIELYKKKADTGDFTDWQYAAVSQLVCDLRLRYGLPQSSVRSHDERAKEGSSELQLAALRGACEEPFPAAALDRPIHQPVSRPARSATSANQEP